MKQWFYHPNEQYGGPKYDETVLAVSSVDVAADRRSLRLRIAGLKAGYVVYLRLADRLRSASGNTLWTAEAWYTLNAIPEAAPAVAIGAGCRRRLARPVRRSHPRGLAQLRRGRKQRAQVDGAGRRAGAGAGGALPDVGSHQERHRLAGPVATWSITARNSGISNSACSGRLPRAATAAFSTW